jgi:UDP-N-acetylmuramate--alanine ligase
MEPQGVLGRTRHIHFVGIGGIGMSGIAELLARLGYQVSGSDLKRSEITDRLERELGVAVAEGHDGGNLGAADVVVVSSAVRSDNPEILEARRRAIPVIPRAEMQAELMRLRYSIAVAGAHGKTTTTSMIALVLERAGLDPTAIIGGRLSAFGSNARLGQGEYVVAEADESDRSFLRYSPTIAVVTNVDHEHLENYHGFDDLCQAFVDFANKVPFYGAVVACADDPELRSLLPRMTRRVVRYGFEDPAADLRGVGPQLGPDGGTCTVVRHPKDGADRGGREPVEGVLALRVPGRHNLLNALAATAVGLELGIGFPQIASALEEFRGAERRFQTRGEAAGGGGGPVRLRPPTPGRLPAAPLHPDEDADGAVRPGAGRRRRDRADRHLRGERGSDPGGDHRGSGPGDPRRGAGPGPRREERGRGAGRCGGAGPQGRPRGDARRRVDRPGR